MTLKKALIASGIWMAIIIAMSAFIIWYMVSLDLPDAEMKERSGMVGSGIGLFAGIGLAVIWIPFASKMGAAQREKRERARRKKTKR